MLTVPSPSVSDPAGDTTTTDGLTNELTGKPCTNASNPRILKTWGFIS